MVRARERSLGRWLSSDCALTMNLLCQQTTPWPQAEQSVMAHDWAGAHETIVRTQSGPSEFQARAAHLSVSHGISELPTSSPEQLEHVPCESCASVEPCSPTVEFGFVAHIPPERRSLFASDRYRPIEAMGAGQCSFLAQPIFQD
jgi:hypothetical protein